MNFECGRFGRRYFLIPSGLALMFELTRSYMDVSLRVYRKLRQAASDALASGSERGYRAVRMKDCNKAAAILRLTCLEHGVQVTKMPDSLPLLHANGIGLIVTWPVEPDAGQRGAKLGELVD